MTMCHGEGCVGLITRDVNGAGARSAGNPHAACDAAETGNGITAALYGHGGGNPGDGQDAAYGLPRQFPTLPGQHGNGGAELGLGAFCAHGKAGGGRSDLVLANRGCRRRNCASATTGLALPSSTARVASRYDDTDQSPTTWLIGLAEYVTEIVSPIPSLKTPRERSVFIPSIAI